MCDPVEDFPMSFCIGILHVPGCHAILCAYVSMFYYIEYVSHIPVGIWYSHEPHGNK